MNGFEITWLKNDGSHSIGKSYIWWTDLREEEEEVQHPLYAIFSRFSRLPPAFILPIVDAAPTTTVSSVLFDFGDVSGPPTNEHRSMVRCGRHLLCIKHKHYILHDLCGSIKHDTVLTFHPRVISHFARSKKLTKFDLLTQRWTHTKVYIFLCIVYVLQWTRPVGWFSLVQQYFVKRVGFLKVWILIFGTQEKLCQVIASKILTE